MDAARDILLHFLCGAAALTALFAVRLPPLRRAATAAYALAALVGLAGLANFGNLRHAYDQGFVNRWELFHYQLGSKYYPELGYDGLYAASYLAQREVAPRLDPGRWIRDVHRDELTTVDAQRDHIAAVRSRFTPERWSAFQDDLRIYLWNTPPAVWQSVRLDHGYNATPFWTFVARLFSGPLPTSYRSLVLLGLIDDVLLVGTFALVFATFGFRAGCLALAIAGLGYGWTYNYLGSFLRLDWLAASVAGVCLLKRDRFALAGACFGYATLSRVFPVLLLCGPALHAFRSLRAGRSRRWALQLGAGFAAMLTIGLVAGSMAGRGPGAWVELGERLMVYRAANAFGSNLVGARNVVLLDPDFIRAGLNGELDEAKIVETLEARQSLSFAVAVALLGLAGVAMWRVGVAESAALGVSVIFALTAPPSYYWIVLILAALWPREGPALAVLGLFTLLYGDHLYRYGVDNTILRHSLMALGLFGVFAVWLASALGRRFENRPQHP